MRSGCLPPSLRISIHVSYHWEVTLNTLKMQYTGEPKVILVGDSGVGKSVWTNTLLGVTTRTVPTLGVELKAIGVGNEVLHPLMPRAGSSVRAWDTAGDPRFRGLGSGYYVGAALAIVMYNPMVLGSLQHVPDWVREIQQELGTEIPIRVVCCLPRGGDYRVPDGHYRLDLTGNRAQLEQPLVL